MMKNLIMYIWAVAMVFSCQKVSDDAENVFDVIWGLKSSKSAKDIISQNTHIDLDTSALLRNPTQLSDTDRAKAKAAVYRFYKHVTIIDGLYVLGLDDVTEINMTKSLFSLFQENLEELNAFIREKKNQGENVELTPITDEYLAQLLK